LDQLLAEAAACGSFDSPATVARLREYGSAEAVRAAIELTRARRKAAAKFPRADRLVADVEAVEQATSHAVARHKASRFIGRGSEAVVDLGCGIGGDAIGLASRGLGVMLVDHRPERAWMARHNVAALSGRRPPTAAADATTLPLDDAWYTLDPSRRKAGRRRHRYADYRPGPAFIERLARVGRGGAIKLGPGVELEALPAGEVEFITDRRTLVQAVLWTGELAGAPRRATVVEPPAELTPEAEPIVHELAGDPVEPAYGEPGAYLLAADPAVERAGLIGRLAVELDAWSIHPRLGLLSRDQPMRSPFGTAFERLATLPWRSKRVKGWLDAHDGGLVEVKTRGGAVDADREARRLRGAGGTPYTVFILRHDRELRAHIARRLD
jgi:hypothetical protein